MSLSDWNPISRVIDAATGLLTKYFPDAQTREKFQADLEAQAAGIQIEHDRIMQQQEEEITKRWQADMASDSWLAKNTRPLMLWALFGLTLYIDVCAVYGWGKLLPEGYQALLNQAFLAALGAYFVVRGVEKVAKSKYTS